MDAVIAAVLATPLAAGLIALAVRKRGRLLDAVAVVGGTLLLVWSLILLFGVRQDGIQVLHAGGWPAPYGITLVADTLAVIMVTLAAITGLAGIVYSTVAIREEQKRHGYYTLVFTLLMGVCGAFLTGDLFNLYVWFEVLLISSFVLMTLGGQREQMEGGLKYVVLNLVASALFLSGLGLLYGLSGTLNMADLSRTLANVEAEGQVTAVAVLFLLAFGVKAALFPLFFWLPASYHTAPAAVGAIFAGLLTKVGVYALIRVFTVVFTEDAEYIQAILLWASIATMVVGVLGAVAHNDVKRILSFHIISQIGYMTLGLALATPLAITGAVFYITHHIIVKANLFLLAGVLRRLGGSYELAQLGGFARQWPFVALLFFISAFSLAGVPPLSGFMAKFIVVRSAIEDESYVAAGVALAVGLLTLFSMTKIWSEAFLKPAPREAVMLQLGRREAVALLLPITCLCALTLSIGLGAEWFIGLAEQASIELTTQDAYARAVLGGGP